MSDDDSKPEVAPVPTRTAKKQKTPAPVGEVTKIQVPHPPASAINKNRPVSQLIRTQLEHTQHAENSRLPKHKRSGIKIEDIRTEAEAASYLASVTKLLHPQGKKKTKTKRRA
jgi:hypothetical protein